MVENNLLHIVERKMPCMEERGGTRIHHMKKSRNGEWYFREKASKTENMEYNQENEWDKKTISW